MKKFQKILMIALIALSNYVKADIWSQYPTPNTLPCIEQPRATDCTDKTRPAEHVVQYRQTDGQVTMRQERTFDLVTCYVQAGKCVDQARNYRGKAVGVESQAFAIYKDFYVYPGSDGKNYAYKNGTGPLFGGQPAGGQAQPTSASKVFDIWCNPQGDTCDYQNQQLTRNQLPQHIPQASDTSNCISEFCYATNGSDVIGLNPDYYIWSK